MYASGNGPKKFKGADGKWKFPFPNRPDYQLSGGLRKAVTYRAYEDAWRVQTGWMSAVGTSAGLTGSYFEEGKTITVNDKMRRLFAKYGSPLSAEKKTITIPKRPSIYPVFYQHEPEVVPYIEGKLQEYIQKGGVPRSSAKKRR
jgi:hypothetical protein